MLRIYVMKQDTTEDLIKKHEGLIYYTLDLLNCSYSDEAKAVAYEALWRAIKTYDKTKGAMFSSYAIVCIRNAIFDLFRKWKEIRYAEVPLEDYPNLAYEQLESSEHQNDPVVQRAVDEVLNNFSPTRRSVAELWLKSNMSTTAIAQEVGCSQSYASQTLKEFKVAVKKELRNAGYGKYFS